MQSVFNRVWAWLHVWLNFNSVRFKDKCEGLIMINLLSLQNEFPSRSKIKTSWLSLYKLAEWKGDFLKRGAPREWTSQVTTQMTQNGTERISLAWLCSSLSRKCLCSKSLLLKSQHVRTWFAFIQTSLSKGLLSEIVGEKALFFKDWWNH